MILFRHLPAFLLFAFPALLHAQLLSQAELDSTKEYYSLESALKDPDHVYRLQLTKKNLKAVLSKRAMSKK